MHASWLNQIEVYLSIVQRKVLTPNDFQSPAHLEDRLLRVQEHCCAAARPFEWKFTRHDLHVLFSKILTYERMLAEAA